MLIVQSIGRRKRELVGFLRIGAVVLGVIALSLSRAADAPPVLDDVVVTGERTGPGMWHVHHGAANVWILGSMTPLPKGITPRSSNSCSPPPSG